jgi:hypothetical protein
MAKWAWDFISMQHRQLFSLGRSVWPELWVVHLQMVVQILGAA